MQETFARNMIARRRSKGLRQADLAELLGMKQQQISAIELARENLTLETIARIAHALGTDGPTMLSA